MYYMQNAWVNWLDKWFRILLAAGILLNASSLFVTVLEPDGALYATIAKNMALSKDFINLKLQGNDWLDKPHFPFWVTACSFSILGISGFAYKLPALLFFLAGGYYTYRFAKMNYSKQVAQLSLLIYLTAEHLVLSNNDVRAEPYLTTLMIAAVYYLHKWLIDRNRWCVLAGSLAAACAVMTKGWFVLPIIFAGFLLNYLLKKNWRTILYDQWWLVLLLVAVFILPELYCLYVQFDSHPEKIVFGRTHVSGIRFFFWDSQFGRFTNSGPIKGEGDPFFYLHTLLWAFLPWSVIVYMSVVNVAQTIFRKQMQAPEYITTGCAVFGFLLFSLSKFQLPHYLNILFPFFSVIAASFLFRVASKRTVKAIIFAQQCIVIVLPLATTALIFYYRFTNRYLIAGLFVLLFAGSYAIFRKQRLANLFGRSFLFILVTNLFLFLFFYPAILIYQAGSEAAFVINQSASSDTVYVPKDYGAAYSFNFYLQKPVRFIEMNEIKQLAAVKNFRMFIPGNYKDSLASSSLQFQYIQSFPHFHISKLDAEFINPATRQSSVSYYHIVIIKQFQPNHAVD